MGTKTYLQGNASATNASSYTFSSQNLGTASADRHIVVVGMGSGGTTDITGITIGGVTATLVIASGAASPIATMYIAAVPTGTTGDIVLTFSGTKSRAGYQAWALTGLDSITPHATDTDRDTTAAGDSLTTNIDIPADGVALSGFYDGSNTTGITWTGLTEDNETVGEADTRYSGASDDFVGSETAYAITATDNGGNNLMAMASASWAYTGGGGATFVPKVMIY